MSPAEPSSSSSSRVAQDAQRQRKQRPRDRQRTLKACRECKQRKQRCEIDGADPFNERCKRCTRYGLPCHGGRQRGGTHATLGSSPSSSPQSAVSAPRSHHSASIVQQGYGFTPSSTSSNAASRDRAARDRQDTRMDDGFVIDDMDERAWPQASTSAPPPPPPPPPLSSAQHSAYRPFSRSSPGAQDQHVNRHALPQRSQEQVHPEHANNPGQQRQPVVSSRSRQPDSRSPLETDRVNDADPRYNGFTALSQHVFWCLAEVCPALQDWDQRQAHIRLRRAPGLAPPPLQYMRHSQDFADRSDGPRHSSVSAKIFAATLCSLFDHFSANILPIFPILSAEQLHRELLTAVQAPSLDSLDPDVDIWLKQRSNAAPLSLLSLAICAVSSMSRARSLDERRAIVFAFRDRLQGAEGHSLLLRTSLRNLQTLLIFSLAPELLSEVSTEAHSLLWMYSGAAFRMAFDLGCHRHRHLNAHNPGNGLSDARERAWKCCVLIDSFNAVCFGQPPTLAPDLTHDDESSNDEAEFGSFASVYEICLASRILYSQINGPAYDASPSRASPMLEASMARLRYLNFLARNAAEEVLEKLPPCAVFARLLLLMAEFNLWRFCQERGMTSRRPSSLHGKEETTMIWIPSLPDMVERSESLLRCFQRNHHAVIDGILPGFNALTVASLLAALGCLSAGTLRNSLVEAEMCLGAWAEMVITDEPVRNREGRVRDKLYRVLQLLGTALRHELGSGSVESSRTAPWNGSSSGATVVTGGGGPNPDPRSSRNAMLSSSSSYATNQSMAPPGLLDHGTMQGTSAATFETPFTDADLAWQLLDETALIFDQWPIIPDLALEEAGAASIDSGISPDDLSARSRSGR